MEQNIAGGPGAAQGDAASISQSLPRFEPVAPATGTLLGAWWHVGTHPTPRTMAAWAQITRWWWVVASFVVSAPIWGIANSIGTLYTSSLTLDHGEYLLRPTAAHIYTVALSNMVAYIFIAPVLALVAALFVPRQHPRLSGSRVYRVLRPWALAQVGLVCVLLLTMLCTLGLAALLQQTHALSFAPAISIAANVLSLVLDGCFLVYVGATLAYATAISGGYVGGWFGCAMLLAVLVAGVIISGILHIAAAHLGIPWPLFR
ncbi:MAG: hypothetical protein OJF49_002334 [Ktedonobacterales bacterium]|jgi:hypothetical protein|nr:MAG: hypothetical protein OJF49_002334 [Ktedonobacterales bacterium]